MKPIGILGGTFDPIHNGHLRLALELLEALNLEAVRLIPLHTPPHREPPVASSELRLAMLEAAVHGEPALIVDDRELRRKGISYTVDTLSGLREEFSNVPLCLIMGMDVFTTLDTWYRWERLIELAHLAVAQRPDARMPTKKVIRDWLTQYGSKDPTDLHREPSGRIFVHAIPQLDISASGIRKIIATGRNPRYLLPDPVIELIEQHHLYRSPAL